jgi:ACS family pantothenate transporter-like MFS transporter
MPRYAFRFFIAFFEAAFQPVSFFLLGSWYTKPELAKRIAIWFIASPAGKSTQISWRNES